MRPFTTKRLNNIESLSITSSVLSMIDGIYVHFEGVTVESRISNFLSALSLIVIFLFYIVIFLQIAIEIKRKDKVIEYQKCERNAGI